MLLSTLRPRMRKKTVEVFLLANTYHSISGSDLHADNVKEYMDTIYAKWDSYLIKLKQNGWDEVGVASICTEGDAEIMAYRLLNKYDKDRYR